MAALSNSWLQWCERLMLVGIPFILLQLLATTAIGALTYGAGTYGTCTYDTCGISVLTSGTVPLSVTPTPTGVHTTASDDVTVSTDASTGYTLTMQDADTNTSLVKSSDTFAASAGTPASPIALAMNTWGYRVDGQAGFGAGPTSAQTSSASALYTFAGVTASNQTTHTLKSTTAAANPADTTKVWFGIRADATKPSGVYTDTVTYTAVTND